MRLSVAGTLLDDRMKEWRAGRTVRVPALLRLPSTYLNPGTPDERPALARRGIALVGTVKSAALVEVVRRGSAWSEAAAATPRLDARGRSSASSRRVDRDRCRGRRRGADRRSQRPVREDERRLQEAGTYHVIAISGGNIAILACRRSPRAGGCCVPRRGRRSSPPRSCCSTAPSPAAPRRSRAPSPSRSWSLPRARSIIARTTLNVLAVAALLAVAATPVVVLDAGFLLSFGATLGILLGVPLLGARRLRSRRRRVSAVRKAGGGAPDDARGDRVRGSGAGAGGGDAVRRVSPSPGFVLNFAAIPLMTRRPDWRAGRSRPLRRRSRRWRSLAARAVHAAARGAARVRRARRRRPLARRRRRRRRCGG